MGTQNTEHRQPHVDTGVCGRCRKPLSQGHRVAFAHIVDATGIDVRDIFRKGVYLMEEFELVHIDCSDVFLVKGHKE